MAANYEAIQRKNKERYGTDVGRYGEMLLSEQYGDRTHFIYELLQNAEDALRRRSDWAGSRAVKFELTENALRVSHFGEPFTEADVEAICGIAQNRKGLTDIGRFGIGFKSVFAYTDRPEVHSGAEDFAIENYVWPVAVPPVQRQTGETVFVLPFRESAEDAVDEISRGLDRLEDFALLFLREIDMIAWRTPEGRSGRYTRTSEQLNPAVRRIDLAADIPDGRDGGGDAHWLVFSRPVARDGVQAGYVEVAFLLGDGDKGDSIPVRRIDQSPLVAFFPTVRETHLGFLVQGPYRTTPSRENVPAADSWNRFLVDETASLVTNALEWLRDQGSLDPDVLRCLPLNRAKFDKNDMFRPLFDQSRSALLSKPLIPCSDGGYASGDQARLGRTEELRELFGPPQLATLFEEDEPVSWITGRVTRARTPELREYFLEELEVPELTPEVIVSALTKPFLEAQSDEWIKKLYDFLLGQRRLRGKVRAAPVIRLEDGTHVPPHSDGEPQAFLPGEVETDFPTVRATLCESQPALEFLKDLGLSEADPVDDVIRNVLPRYQGKTVQVTESEFREDLDRILGAFETDSQSRRGKLVKVLRNTAFLRAVESGTHEMSWKAPGELYLPTERLRVLFDGVSGVWFVDTSMAMVDDDRTRRLLVACGALPHLRPVEKSGRTLLTETHRAKLRESSGHPETSGQNDKVVDQRLEGLSQLLSALPKLERSAQRERALVLWQELAELESRCGKEVFTGVYTWTHYGKFSQNFDAEFVRQLNERPWIPGNDGRLECPRLVLFRELDWPEHPFLQSKIEFRSPKVEQLASEIGIEPELLEALQQHGITRAAELLERLGVEEGPGQSPPGNGGGTVEPPRRGRARPGQRPPGKDGGRRGQQVGPHQPVTGTRTATGGGTQPHAGATRQSGPRSFISYVAVHSDADVPDPDGLEHEARFRLEDNAVAQILAEEPNWHRAPPNNPGFDLSKRNEEERDVEWCEVKAMTGTLDDRPVGMSRAQFRFAQEKGAAFWLYIVERAGTDEARILRINDPAGLAATYTFDRGWREAAKAGGGPTDDHVRND